MLTLDERNLIEALSDAITGRKQANRLHESYYDGSFPLKFLGIGLPDEAKQLQVVAGWPATAVNVLEERLSFLGWDDDDLREVFDRNKLVIESSQVHLESLIHGISFVSVTSGGEGEPEVMIRGHNPQNATGIINQRTGLLDVGFTREMRDGEMVTATLWTKREVVTARRKRGGDPWSHVERVPHGLGAVPLVAVVNQPRVGMPYGKSEITKALRGYTDSASRALVAMDVNREFFSAPQRYALNVDQEKFVGPDGVPKSAWQMVTGRLWAVPPDEDGAEPKLGQFDPISPGPYLEQVKGLAQLVAAESAIPPTYLGFSTDNPSSADAIKQMEARLVRRAVRRQSTFGEAWAEVGRLALSALSGGVVAEQPRVMWENASTPTLASTMDAVVKYVQVGGASADDRVMRELIGFSPAQIAQLEASDARRRADMRMRMLQAQSGGVPEEATELARASREVTDGGEPAGED